MIYTYKLLKNTFVSFLYSSLESIWWNNETEEKAPIPKEKKAILDESKERLAKEVPMLKEPGDTIKESNDRNNPVDKIIYEVMRTRWLDVWLWLDIIRKELESEVSDNFYDETIEDLNELILKKYTTEELEKRIEEIVRKEATNAWANETNEDTIKKLKESKNDEEKMAIMQDKLSYAQENYPSSWVEKLIPNNSTWDTSNMSEMEKIFISLITFLTWKNLFSQIWWSDFLPSKAWDMIGWKDSSELWSLSEHFESWWKWPNAINPNDGWKPSFGTYQLRDEMLKNFIISNPSLAWYPSWYNKVFEKWSSTEFSTWWNNKVGEIGVKKFKEMEHSFIKKEFYDKQVNIIKSLNVNINDFPIVIQNVVWSTAVQNGQNTSILTNAIKENWGLKKWDPKSMVSFIEIVYRLRTDIHTASKNRYNSERAIVLANLNLWTQWIWVEWISWVRSLAIERSEKWTPLCSKTARLNASRFWIIFPQGSSAKNSYELSWNPKSIFPPTNSNSKFADIYLDASSNNKEYWHRAFAFQEKWNWFILDPYYSIPWVKNRRSAIPAEKYLDHMWWTKWRRFWWAKFYS